MDTGLAGIALSPSSPYTPIQGSNLKVRQAANPFLRKHGNMQVRWD